MGAARRWIRSCFIVTCLGLVVVSCSADKVGVYPVLFPEAAEPAGLEVLVTPELVAVADLRPGDDLFRLPVGEFSVLVRVRAGEAPFLFGTSCDVVSSAQLPAGWQGVCLEYTDGGQRVHGEFPWGATSAGG